MKYITPDNLYDYAFLNEDTLQKPVKGVCIYFHGFTDGTRYNESPFLGAELGAKGIAWVFPYHSVWAWMSQTSQQFCEQVIDAVYEKLGIDESIPLVVTGGSMGGMTALNYLLHGKRKAIACAANCPVLSVKGYFEAAREARAAILSAHIEKQGELTEILTELSPIYITEKLPKIPYFLVFGKNDPSPAINEHIEELKEKLSKNGIDYKVEVREEMAHCNMNDFPDTRGRFIEFILKAFKCI